MATQLDRPAGRASQARAFVDRLLDTVEALVVVLDTDRRIVRFNRKCQEITGYSASEARGEDIVEFLIPPEDRTEVRKVFDTLTDGKAPLSCENDWLTKEGDRRCIQWTNTILRDEEGQVARVVGTGIDVTKCRRLEREVVATSEEERRRIGAELHDMLAPQLAGTAMMLDALAKEMEEKNSEVASEIHVAADRVREVGEQTRTLSHSLMPLAINGGNLPSGLRDLAERQEEMRNFACSFKEDPVPVLREETASHLYHIASEAVTNAAQHASPSTVTIRLGTSDDRLVLSVRDDGAGMPEGTGPSAGAGLHLMQARAELIGADLEIDAAEGVGTLVRCSLPLGEQCEGAG